MEPSSGTRTFVCYVEDRPGVLNHVASLFRRRSFNIVSLNVGPSQKPGVSRMTIVVECDDDDTAHRIEANLYKLVNVLRVEDVSHVPTVHRVLALIKIACTQDNRAEILQICSVFRARIVDVARDALIAEISGSPEKIGGLVTVLEPFGIIEMAQNGAVSMKRGADATAAPDSTRRAKVA